MLPSKRCPGRYHWKKPRPAIVSYGRFFLVSLLIFPLNVGCSANPSADSANVDGVVAVDGSGLAGVRVRLINEAGEVVREKITSSDGQYAFTIEFFGDILGSGSRDLTVTIDQIPSGIVCPTTSQRVVVRPGDDLFGVNFECVRSS